jgi:hypothetical protein
MVRYSILMPYVHRPDALRNTLLSLAHHYRGRRDYEVLILEDVPQDRKIPGAQEALDDLLREHSHEVPLSWCPVSFLDTYNPCRAYNHGAKVARGSVLLLTSPEVFHLADVLAGLDAEFEREPESYVVCSCEAAAEGTTRADSPEGFRYKRAMWYQHSRERNVLYHFCNAIPRQAYLDLGGMCEEFAGGIAYEDNDFRDRVLASGLRVVTRDDLRTVHQWHPKLAGRASGYRQKVARNRDLYERRCRERGQVPRGEGATL